jgi:hypothetical protein
VIVEAAESRCRVCLCVCTDEEHALTIEQAEALELDAATAVVCFDCWRRVAPATTVTRAAVVPCGCLDAYVVPVPGCTEGRVVATLRERTPPHAMVCPSAFAEGATQGEAVERALGALRTALTMPPRAE